MDFIKILRKQLAFSVKLMKPLPFHTPIPYPQTPRWRRLHGIKKGSAPAARALILIRYPHTNSIYSYSRLRKARIQGALRPVVVTRPTSTTSRGDQYCLLLVTSTGSIADQYWSQSPSSAASHNYLYTREVRRTASELPPHAGQAVGPDRYEEGQRAAAPRAVYVLSA